MVDILQNEIKKDEPVSVQEPSLSGYGEQVYLDNNGQPVSSSSGSKLLYLRTIPVIITSTNSAYSNIQRIVDVKIKGGTLGTGGLLKVKMVLANMNRNGVNSADIIFYYGGDLIADQSNIALTKGGLDAGGTVEATFFINPITNVMSFVSYANMCQSGVSSAALLQSVDSSTNLVQVAQNPKIDQDFVVGGMWSAVSANNTFTVVSATVELIK